jgi:ribose transport system substrate-binding protein
MKLETLKLIARLHSLSRPCSVAIAIVIGLGSGLVAYSAFAQEAEHEVMNSHGDITKMCGTKPAIIGHLDGFGGATWFKTTAAEFKDELMKCPTVKKVIYLDANNDPQRYNSDINSLVAQGVNVLVAFTHFGDASLPAFKAATKAGVTVVPYFSKISGEIPKDYAGRVYQDTTSDGVRWADWLAKSIKSGNVVFLGGPPGATSSERFLNGFKKGLANYPDLHLLEQNYIVTSWNPVDAQKAVSALIAKYPKIDGIASDYGVTTMAAIKAFEQSGLPIPAQATVASNNELNCKYLEYKKQGKAWQYYSVDGTNSLIRFAARRALALYEGTKNDEAEAIWTYDYANSLTGLDPKCDPTLPPDADLSGQLGDEKLKKLLLQ